MNKKEKIAAYVEAYKEVFKNYEFLLDIAFNENVLGELKKIYEELFEFVLDIEQNESYDNIQTDIVIQPQTYTSDELVELICKYCLLAEPHSKREKVEKYIDTSIAADAKLNKVSPYITDRALEMLLKPYWDLEKNILDIPEEKKELLFYYRANEIDMTKEEVINIIAG